MLNLVSCSKRTLENQKGAVVRAPAKKGHKKTVDAFAGAHGAKRKCAMSHQGKLEHFSPLKMGTLTLWASGGGVLEIFEGTIR